MYKKLSLYISWITKTNRRRKYTINTSSISFLLIFTIYLSIRLSTLELDFNFLSQPAGFSMLNQWLTDYQSSDSRIIAYLTASFNTIRLVIIAIIFSTLIGLIVGLSRLSSNWLISKMALIYINIFRNTPLLVQIVFWCIAIFLNFPNISEGKNISELIFISNRGLVIPWFNIKSQLLWIFIFGEIILITVSFLLRSFINNINNNKETKYPENILSIVFFIICSFILLFLTNISFTLDLPTLTSQGPNIFNYNGGLLMTPEFCAVLLGLSVYTGSFIAEIVRGSIQALPKGQTEAAMSVGLSNYQRLTLIILPQALRIMIPSITNQYLNVTKNSSLAVVIGYSELFLVSGIIINKAGHAVPMYFMIIVTYQCISWIISIGMNYFNKRVQLIGN